MDTEEIGDLAGTDTSVAAMSTAGKPAPRRHLFPGVFATTAAVLLLVFSGVGLAAKSAQPGDRLWSLTKVLYGDYAHSVEATQRVKDDLAKADTALKEGNTSQAQESLASAREQLSDVDDEQNRDNLAAQYEWLQAMLDQNGENENGQNENGQELRQTIVDGQKSFLRDGQLAYRVPGSMKQENWYRVVVRASGLGYILDPAALPGEGLTDTHEVKVGPDLVADLDGPDFSISRVPPDDGRRTLATQDYAEWQWNVKPVTTGGQGELTLVLSVHLPDGNQPPISIQTVTRKVSIETNVSHVVGTWVKEYWPATGLTIPAIAGGIWICLRLRRSAGTPSERNVDKPMITEVSRASGHQSTDHTI